MKKDLNNPWHKVGVGKNAPEVVNAIIEIPKDSHVKYELDKETGMLKVDRFLYSAVHYPGDYGFVPQTLWHDNDPLDILVLTGRPVFPMTLVNVRVIGVLRMIDGEEQDDKIISVYSNDPRYSEVESITQIPKHTLNEIKHFFETYKELQGKKCKVLKILDKKDALNDISKAQEMYQQKFLD